MKDSFGREISYLRVSVTKRCNLNCVYCGKSECEKKESELTAEQIEEIVRAFASCGITKVRLTGGEPLLRGDICDVAERIHAIDGIEKLSITTNGVYLDRYARGLKKAGVGGVNVSLDSVDAEKYKALTGADALDRVLRGIDAARSEGLSPIKINAVLMRGVNDEGAGKLIDVARVAEIDVRFIELMPFSSSGEDSSLVVTGGELLKEFDFLEYAGTDGTARYYSAPGFRGRVGFIDSVSHKFCSECSRIRLLSDGTVKPCLGFDETYDLKPYLGDETRLKKRIEEIIMLKPAGHSFESRSPGRGLNRTGG